MWAKSGQENTPSSGRRAVHCESLSPQLQPHSRGRFKKAILYQEGTPSVSETHEQFGLGRLAEDKRGEGSLPGASTAQPEKRNYLQLRTTLSLQRQRVRAANISASVATVSPLDFRNIASDFRCITPLLFSFFPRPPSSSLSSFPSFPSSCLLSPTRSR